AVAEFLDRHDMVKSVNYCGLIGNKYYSLAKKYMPNGTCGVVTFSAKGGRKNAETFMSNLKLAAIVTHVADSRTSVLHPAGSTHRQMNDQELAAAGVTSDMIRLSVGIEDISDILQDLENALSTIR
ncbi:MAG: O-acetylhomoserine aminocarboxypropyltransferase/cysteine synthase, partial [Clostridiales bacterium]|nr:O-acetylhomoserine aminocarboxypropyltransferase/cysteine synthase [Clostridiales bacterium]